MTSTVQAIAWTLIHFCWQAAAIAMAYRCVSFITAHRSSNARYLLALSTLLLMLAASVATFAFEMRANSFTPVASVSAGTSARYTISPVKTPAAGTLEPAASQPFAASGRTTGNALSLPALPLLAVRLIDGVWLLGILALSIRSLGGWWLIQRLRASATVEAPAAVRASFRNIARALGLQRPVLLRVSSAIAGPATVGAIRALVLLPLSAVTSLGPDELEVVLAHELAHVRRADFFWNLVQTLVETLFFFHPAVWFLGSRIRHERELCCDDLALAVCPNPVAYANALFQLEQQRSRRPQLAMAFDGHQPACTLRTRIARILGEPIADSSNRATFALAAAAAVLVVLLLPVPQVLASLNPASTAVHPQVAVSAPVVVSGLTVSATADRIAPVAASVTAPVVVNATAPVVANVTPLVNTLASSSFHLVAAAELQQSEPEKGGGKNNYIDRMKAAGYDVDLDKLIAMKIQDVTPEYAAAMSQLGFGKLSADDLIACRIQGVTPEYIAQLKQRGIEVKDASQAISFRIFEVTPEFVAGMKAAGFTGISSEQLVALRVQGITPEYAQEIAKQFPGVTADDLVKTRIFKIDAAFIESARKHGFTDLTLEKLVRLRISGLLDDESSKQ